MIELEPARPDSIEVQDRTYVPLEDVLSSLELREGALDLAKRRGARSRYSDLVQLFALIDGAQITAARRWEPPALRLPVGGNPNGN